MSKISLKPNASGTGVFSLEAPNSNVDRTLNLPDEAGTLATVENLPAGYTDSDALDLFNATGTAPVYACRAWVNFNGQNTVSIRDSGNVSSIIDRGIGHYTVSFTTAMPDTNYSVTGSAVGVFNGTCLSLFGSGDNANQVFAQDFEINTRGNAGSGAGGFYDPKSVCLSIFR